MGKVIEFPKGFSKEDNQHKEKLEALKQQIKNGEYKIDLEKLAEYILKSGVLDE